MSRPDKVEIPMSRNRRVWLARLLRSAAQRLDPSPITVDRNPGGGVTVKFHDRPLAHVVTGDQIQDTRIQDTRIGTPHDAPRAGDTVIPASTAAIAQGMITDLREMANPRRQRDTSTGAPTR